MPKQKLQPKPNQVTHTRLGKIRYAGSYSVNWARKGWTQLIIGFMSGLLVEFFTSIIWPILTSIFT